MSRLKAIWRCLGFALFVLFFHQTSAQQRPNNAKPIRQEAEKDSFMIKIPTLDVLIDSALNHAPELKMYAVDMKMRQLDISNSKKNWSKNIVSGSASYNYGDNLLLNDNLGLGQLSSGSEASSHYSVGLALKIPIAMFFDHQELKKSLLEKEKTEAQQMIIVQSIRENVNTRYLNMLNAYEKYKTLLTDKDSYEINLQTAEHDFLNSRISVQDLTSFKSAYSKTKLDLVQAKNEFNNALWLLEELVGFRLKF